MFTTLAVVVAFAIAQPSGVDFDLLPFAERKDIKDRIAKIEKGGAKVIEDIDLALISRARRFYMVPKVQAALVQVADRDGAEKYLANMGLQKRKDLQAIKINFALINAIDKNAVLELSAKIKKSGLDSLNEAERERVIGLKTIFYPPDPKK